MPVSLTDVDCNSALLYRRYPVLEAVFDKCNEQHRRNEHVIIGNVGREINRSHLVEAQRLQAYILPDIINLVGKRHKIALRR